HDRVELVMVAEEERAALRLFLRALRTIDHAQDWRATIWSSRPLAAPATLSRALQGRVRFVGAAEMTQADALAEADVVVLASEGIRPLPRIIVRALAGRAVPVASRLPA